MYTFSPYINTVLKHILYILHKKAQNIHANVQFFQKWKHSKNMNLIKTHNQYLFTW